MTVFVQVHSTVTQGPGIRLRQRQGIENLGLVRGVVRQKLLFILIIIVAVPTTKSE